jgi:hypothetical protein
LAASWSIRQRELLKRAMAGQVYECATVTVTVDVAVRLPISETFTQ